MTPEQLAQINAQIESLQAEIEHKMTMLKETFAESVRYENIVVFLVDRIRQEIKYTEDIETRGRLLQMLEDYNHIPEDTRRTAGASRRR